MKTLLKSKLSYLLLFFSVLITHYKLNGTVIQGIAMVVEEHLQLLDKD